MAALVVVVLLAAGVGFAWAILANVHIYPSLQVQVGESGPGAWRRATEDLIAQAAGRGYNVEWLKEGDCFILQRADTPTGDWRELHAGGDWVETTLDMADLYQGISELSAVEVGCYRRDQEPRIWVSLTSRALMQPGRRNLFKEALLEWASSGR